MPHNTRITHLQESILKESAYHDSLEKELIADAQAFMDSRSIIDDKVILSRITDKKVALKASKSYLTRMKNELEHLQKSNGNTTFTE